MSPSEFLTLPLATDFPSPLPFSRLGVPLDIWPILGVAFGVRAFRAGVLAEMPSPADSGLGGRLPALVSTFGGWGNELMLTVLRIVFPLGVGRADVGAGAGGGRCAVDGARRPVFGVLGDLLGVPRLFLVLATGNAGRAVVGGPVDGRDGFGKPVDILSGVLVYRSYESIVRLRREFHSSMKVGYMEMNVPNRIPGCCRCNEPKQAPTFCIL